LFRSGKEEQYGGRHRGRDAPVGSLGRGEGSAGGLDLGRRREGWEKGWGGIEKRMAAAVNPVSGGE
jgi:hypothetical protein